MLPRAGFDQVRLDQVLSTWSLNQAGVGFHQLNTQRHQDQLKESDSYVPHVLCNSFTKRCPNQVKHTCYTHIKADKLCLFWVSMDGLSGSTSH